MRSKKFVILYAVAIFLIVFLITFNSVCAISSIEIYYEVDGSRLQLAEEIRGGLEERYLRKNFLFFDEEGAVNYVSDETEGYFEVTELTKSFPNRISMRIREKYENYAFVREEKGADGEVVKTTYYVIGDDGTVLAVKDSNVNNLVPEQSNIEVTGFEFFEPAVGEVFAVDAGQTAAYEALRALVAELNARGLRGNIERIEYFSLGASDPSRNIDYFYIYCTEGVQIWVTSPSRNAEIKIAEALDVYEALGDIERTYGYIAVNDLRDPDTGDYSDVTAVYSPNVPPKSGN